MTLERDLSDQAYECELADFLREFPQFSGTAEIDELRKVEFSRLDQEGHVYLDFTGAGLYAASQVRRHSELLLSQVLGNPHSSNPVSRRTRGWVEDCRDRVLRFFNASPDEYTVIFTSNASHALKLVGESYPFQAGDLFLLTFDNHNSVNGIREFDRARGAVTTYVPVIPPEMRVDDSVLDSFFEQAKPAGHNLFAYPAQSNFSGVQHPLTWIDAAHEKGWDVLLDAAAFVPTNRLDLSLWHPDFTAISFYKIFGYPTGVGALIARKQSLAKLRRPWFAGGTITVASVQADTHQLASGGEAFEDGTLDYANLPAVKHGLDFIDQVGLECVHRRVQCLTGWLLRRLLALEHSNGRPLVQIYGPRTCHARGATVTMNFFGPDGHVIDHDVVEQRANQEMISLRTGCFCNPGAGEIALGLSREQLVGCLSRTGMTYQDFRSCISSDGSGAVRVSTGLVSTFRDVYRFLRFAGGFLAEADHGSGPGVLKRARKVGRTSLR